MTVPSEHIQTRSRPAYHGPLLPDLNEDEWKSYISEAILSAGKSYLGWQANPEKSNLSSADHLDKLALKIFWAATDYLDLEQYKPIDGGARPINAKDLDRAKASVLRARENLCNIRIDIRAIIASAARRRGWRPSSNESLDPVSDCLDALVNLHRLLTDHIKPNARSGRPSQLEERRLVCGVARVLSEELNIEFPQSFDRAPGKHNLDNQFISPPLEFLHSVMLAFLPDIERSTIENAVRRMG